MSILRTITNTVLGLALTGAVLSPLAKADEWNKKTTMTFSQPVEIPGVHLKGWSILPAGTYVFKIFDSQTDRHIVQIFNQDETQIYATILAIPNYRLKATDKTVVTFRERPAGQPEALRAWFYPGENYGAEFVYPKTKAVELASTGNTVVLFTPAELPAEVTDPVALTAEPTIAQLKEVPVKAVQPTGEEVEIAAVVAPAPAVVAAQPAAVAPETAPMQVAAVEMPKTASFLPLIGLLGLMALGGALVLRKIQTRIL
jgi:hypothetical protein